MSQELHLLEEYSVAMADALRVAPIKEQSLYTLHAQELERLSMLLQSAAPMGEVASLLAGERRAFGWSFLSGSHGERVERAFHALASFLEQRGAAAENGA